MKLDELEKQLGVVFPKTFHDIYETGAMKWLEMTTDELKSRRQEYINDPKAFLMLSCSCEPYLFDEIPAAENELKEWISRQEKDTKASLSEDVTLIPFGHSGGGDMYCFLYTKDKAEPSVILYYHDEYGDPGIIGHDFDEFLYTEMLDAVSYYADYGEEEDSPDGESFQSQLLYLNDVYRQKIVGKDIDDLLDDYNAMIFEKAKIWR